jgi:surface carbohydrate biosynthesis protein
MSRHPKFSNSPRPPVYIESQVTSRDLHARLLLGARLAALGHPVLVGRAKNVSEVARVNLPGIYIGDHGFLSDRYRRFRESGFLTYTFCEESTAFVSADLYKKIRLSPVALRSSKALFCTNGQQLELINEVLGHAKLPPRYNTGNIRFELVGTKLRGLYYEKVTKLRNQYKDFNLITTNGKLRNALDVESKAVSLITRWGLTTEDASRFKQLVLDRARAQEQFIIDVLDVARSLPSQKFILRAKYNEIRFIRRLVGKRLPSNVLIDSSGSIQPWVLAAKAVVQNNCTTGMDAYAAGTPSIFYCSEHENVEVLEGPAAVSCLVRGTNDLRKILQTPPVPNDLSESEIERYMPSVMRDSHVEIANQIARDIDDFTMGISTHRFDSSDVFAFPRSQRKTILASALRSILRPSSALGGAIRWNEVAWFIDALRGIDSSLSEVRLWRSHFEVVTLSRG